MAAQQQEMEHAAGRGGGDGRPMGQGGDSTTQQHPHSGEGRPSGGPEAEEIEEVANSYFQKIYTSDMSIEEVIQLLKRFKASSDPREQEIFRCMIHNLFDEYRFFHKYPEKELQVTGRLFGTLIQNQLVSSITLGIALRYVLEALRKDPEQGGSNEKMFRFGKISLEQFRSRLNEWPQYCSHLVQISHLANHCPDLFAEAQRAVNNPAPAQAGNGQAPEASAQGPKSEDPSRGSNAFAPTATYEAVALAQVSAQAQAAMASDSASKGGSAEAGKTVDAVIDERRRKSIERMCAINMETQEVQVPSEAARDQILFIVNNIAKNNVEVKTNELRSVMEVSHYSWFANYLIVKRVSTQPNLHQTYLAVIDIMDSPSLLKAVLISGYHNITKLLQSSKITTSSSERSLLRNLGMWLGQLTLARNKPILQRRCDLKELLLWGYESGRLIAVCSFVAKTVEGCKESKIFRPPNPWLMAVLGVMRELFEVEDLKMNIKFEVQVLCKNIGVRIEDIPKSDLVARCTPPVKEKNPDFNVKSSNQTISPSPVSMSSPPLSTMTTPVQASPLPPRPSDVAPDADQPQEHTVIPNLASHIMINPALYATSMSHQVLRRIVPLAVDRAIREIIQPVVERSVTIACVTTQQLILKDFALEPNEAQLRKAAHLMVSNLAGRLAVVTCKEPLRVSIGNHLRSLLGQSNGIDQNAMEQVVQVCSGENLELGCMLIEKAATEKAVRDIDEALAPAIQLRRKHSESGTPFADAIALKGSQFPKDLPDAMRPSVGGLTPPQALVYDGFHRQRTVANAGTASSPQQSHLTSGASPHMSGVPAGRPLDGKPSPRLSPNLPPTNAATASLSMAQALESYQHALSRVDSALKSVMVQAQGRDVSLAMLGGDQEILARLRDIFHITQCTVAGVRIEKSVFKRLVETVAVNDSLRLEVMVGILEALRDACGGFRKFTPDMISWLSQYATFNVSEEPTRKLHRDILTLLMRAKLLRAPEVDTYFANNLDSGRNMVWVELALGFIRHSLAEGLAATYEFAKVFDIVSKMRPSNTAVRKQLQKWLTDIRALAAAREDQKAPAAGGPPGSASPSRDSVRDHVMLLLDRWLRVWASSNDQVFGQYLQLLHQYGVLKTEEAADRFFRIACEICVEACMKNSQNTGDGSTLAYTVIDALSKLFLLLVRLADKEASDVAVRINLLNRILHAVARALVDDHEAKKAAGAAAFDQRPYCRLFSNLMQDLGTVDPKQESSPAALPLLATYSQIYLALQPSTVPGFCFGWLQLISHKCFMPQLLHGMGQKGWPLMHRLLLVLLQFLQPYLRNADLPDPIRRLYKGTLRVLLILLHDFP
ncbi:CNOT1, partial [Symbiodinium microadriaticum]